LAPAVRFIVGEHFLVSLTGRFGRIAAGGLFLCGILVAAGCGGQKGEVSGKVSYQGQPVRGGMVSFIPEAGGLKTSAIEEDGSYTVRDVPLGPVKITVETDSFRPPVMPQGGPGSGGPPESVMKYMKEKNATRDDPKRAKRYVRIPPSTAIPANPP
jgi:hypothetical protein